MVNVSKYTSPMDPMVTNGAKFVQRVDILNVSSSTGGGPKNQLQVVRDMGPL